MQSLLQGAVEVTSKDQCSRMIEQYFKMQLKLTSGNVGIVCSSSL